MHSKFVCGLLVFLTNYELFVLVNFGVVSFSGIELNHKLVSYNYY